LRLFPFSAIVGQDLLKKGLLVNAVDPTIGGVLIRGEKGTGKTTAVRAFAAVLPTKETVSGCRFGCLRGVPPCTECEARSSSGEVLVFEERPVEVVDLPLNASEDRVVGSLDLEAALREGSKRFEMGVLGKANGNLLYIDEVNLLDDHVVDVLLDVAVSGRNVVMREGVTYSHPSRFLLVGTMNPEEGELRPQLLDRFGLCVEVSGEKEISLRKQIVDRVLSFERGEPEFLTEWDEQDAALRERLLSARRTLPSVQVSDDILQAVVEVVSELGVAGHRGDITILKSARALAAFKAIEFPDEECLADAFRMSLPHRLKEDPFEETASGRRRLDAVLSRFGVPGQGR
jgi:magnesium chelatase subunit I